MNLVPAKWLSVPVLFRVIVFYLYLPLFLFVFGWLNPVIAVVIFLISLAGIWAAMKEIEKGRVNEYVPISKKETLIFFLLFAVFLIFVGHGDLMPQDFDWHKHHAIYYDLMNYAWPVEYQGDVMLTYYLGQYIVPAAIAKLFFKSHFVLNVAIVAWNAFGLLLTYLFLLFFLSASKKKSKLLVFVVLIIWGGVTNVGQIVYRSILAISQNQSLREMLTVRRIFDKWLNMRVVCVHFTSNYDTMYGAFQHLIAPWLAGCLFLGNREKRECYVLMGVPLLFSSSFGFVYFCILLFGMALYDLLRKGEIAAWFRSVFSTGNLLLLPLFGVFAIYLLGGVVSEQPDEMGLRFFLPWDGPVFYLSFVFCEFMCYGIVLFHRNRRNPLFYAVIIELLLIPIPMLGLFNDLCSRGAIPARFILMVLCLEMLLNMDWSTIGQRIANVILVLLLLLSASRAAFQMMNSGLRLYSSRGNREMFLADDYKSFEGYAGNPDERVDNAYNYYTFQYSEGIFYRIARHKAE